MWLSSLPWARCIHTSPGNPQPGIWVGIPPYAPTDREKNKGQTSVGPELPLRERGGRSWDAHPHLGPQKYMPFSCPAMLPFHVSKRKGHVGWGGQKLFVGSVARVPGRRGWGTMGYRASVSKGVAKGPVL